MGKSHRRSRIGKRESFALLAFLLLQEISMILIHSVGTKDTCVSRFRQIEPNAMLN